MKLVSLNAGLPREVAWRGKQVRTSIWKSPLPGRARVSRLNVEGDGQSDLSVHGGVDKAVYAYPSEHYPYWRGELPDAELPWGVFGENLTTEGLLEDEVQIGDRFRVGTVELMVTQPRMPCFKLGIRFGRADMVKRLLQSKRSGFYLEVLREGELGAGDSIQRTERVEGALTVVEIVTLYTSSSADPGLLRRASELAALPEEWREDFRRRLAAAS